MNKLLWMLLLITSFCQAQTREIAITIDDLPLVASKMDTPNNQKRAIERFQKIIEAFQQYQVPVTGFVIAGSIGKGQWAFLESFRNAGFTLGNHTYSHYNLNRTKTVKYIEDIDKADKVLTPIMTEPKYFRYPYLAEGSKTAKPEVQAYLKDHAYVIAPVTVDSKDFALNEALYRIPFRQREGYIQKLKSRYLNFVWNQTLKAEKKANGAPVKQILLIHANLLNSYLLPDLLAMYQKNGYKFIPLSEALKNPAPALIISSGEEVKNPGAHLDEGIFWGFDDAKS